MKRTIKRVIRARLEVSRDNELLLICLVHNLCKLIEARIEYDVPISRASTNVLAAIDAIAEKYTKVA